MFILPLLLAVFVAAIFAYRMKTNWMYVAGLFGLLVIITATTVGIDYSAQTTAVEVWSGTITDVYHKEEWNEYHPARTETHQESYKDSSGNTKYRLKTKYIPAYTEHHPSIDRITTSDSGQVDVNKSQEGKEFNDSFPNSVAELSKHYIVGSPSASAHTYENKIKASYSIYRHEEINPKDFPDLPEYPSVVKGYVNVDRIIGNVPNKKAANLELATWNSYLNKFIPDPDNPGKKRSYKQVNVIFVNLGDKTEDWGYALQDKWQNGNKNDFVIAYGSDSTGKITWVNPFSWSEVEILKLEIRDYMLGLGTIKDFKPVVKDVCKTIENKFVRKQFADFNYLSVEASKAAIIILWFLDLLSLGVFFYASVEEKKYKSNYYRG